MTCTPNLLIKLVTEGDTAITLPWVKKAIYGLETQYSKGGLIPSILTELKALIQEHGFPDNHHFVIVLAFMDCHAFYTDIQRRTSYDLSGLRKELYQHFVTFLTGNESSNELLRVDAFLAAVRKVIILS